jgi:hypothetical protein
MECLRQDEAARKTDSLFRLSTIVSDSNGIGKVISAVDSR